MISLVLLHHFWYIYVKFLKVLFYMLFVHAGLKVKKKKYKKFI